MKQSEEFNQSALSGMSAEGIIKLDDSKRDSLRNEINVKLNKLNPQILNKLHETASVINPAILYRKHFESMTVKEALEFMRKAQLLFYPTGRLSKEIETESKPIESIKVQKHRIISQHRRKIINFRKSGFFICLLGMFFLLLAFTGNEGSEPSFPMFVIGVITFAAGSMMGLYNGKNPWED